MVIKGGLLGILFFVVFAVLYYPRWLRSVGLPKDIGTHYAVDPMIFFQNPLFWSALFLCLSIGLGITGYWRLATWKPPS